jgi:3-oxoadipate enol-lactonase
MRIAARHGHLLRSLTVLDSSADREPTVSAVKDTAMALVYPLVGARVLMPFVLPIMFGPTFRNDTRNKPVIDEFVRGLARCARLGTSRAVFAVAARKPVRPELARISVPTLVIVGADDVATKPDKARRIAAGISGARLEIVTDSGHSSTVEQPARITELLDKFLAELE